MACSQRTQTLQLLAERGGEMRCAWLDGCLNRLLMLPSLPLEQPWQMTHNVTAITAASARVTVSVTCRRAR
jgi:hypothetical protein